MAKKTDKPFKAKKLFDYRPASKKLSRNVKPDDMTLEEWQTELRRQFGRSQRYRYENIGEEKIFSDYLVTNPESKNTYRVAIRGTEPGDSYCACADFATNTLGTCKHIEFMIGVLEDERGAQSAFLRGFQPKYSEVFLKYGAQRKVFFRPGTTCPPEFLQLAQCYFENNILRPMGYGAFDEFLAQAGKIDHELRVYDDTLSFIAEVRDNDTRRRHVDEAFPHTIRSSAFDTLLKVNLYDYQREAALFTARAGRVLIGDEMGLGKTIQAIAAAEILARLAGVERVLVVCPTSLKHQWEREILKFAERSVQVINGLQHVRKEMFEEPSFFKITNYDTVGRDLDVINRWSPDLVILDEAQRIKNWKTKTAQSVKKIESPYAVVLTGTPLENRLQELMSIVQFIDQHRLGPTFRFLHNHQITDNFGRVIGYKDLDQINHSLSPVLLRRRKSEVLTQLPPRLDQHLFVQMTPQQLEVHEEFRQVVGRLVHKWRTHGFLSEGDQRRLMTSLQYMRMSCDSTYLIDQQTWHGTKADELLTLLEEMLEQPETKVVIFSQWLRMHEVLVKKFGKKRKWDYVLFHGSIDSTKRGELIDRFRDDPKCRVFLSTDAGGVGLNLQHASVIINMDMPWNPAVLEQRIGRVHRLGQTQPVQVINFVAQGTIEEGMLSVLSFKKSLFEGALDGGAKEVFLGGSRLTKFMETVENVTGKIPTAHLEDDSEFPGSWNDDLEPSSAKPTSPAEVSDTAETAAAESSVPASPLVEQEAEPISPPPTPTASGNGDPWKGLLQNGLMLLQQLASAADVKREVAKSEDAKPEAAAHNRQESWANSSLFEVSRDDKTGRSCVKIQMPEPEVIHRAVDALGALIESLRNK